MNHTIQLTTEQFQALQSGQPITIEPPKPTITKWEPIGGRFTVDVIKLNSYEICSENKYRLAGVEYQIKAQANSAAKAIRAYARQLAWLAENDDGWVADWNNTSTDANKYYVYFDHTHKKAFSTYKVRAQSVGLVYMSKQNAEKLAQLMNDGIVEF